VAGCCENGTEPSGCLKGREISWAAAQLLASQNQRVSGQHSASRTVGVTQNAILYRAFVPGTRFY
jgi:hypothetical protein